MNRRGFLARLLAGVSASVAAQELDLDRLLWVPGAKKIFIPAAPTVEPGFTFPPFPAPLFAVSPEELSMIEEKLKQRIPFIGAGELVSMLRRPRYTVVVNNEVAAEYDENWTPVSAHSYEKGVRSDFTPAELQDLDQRLRGADTSKLEAHAALEGRLATYTPRERYSARSSAALTARTSPRLRKRRSDVDVVSDAFFVASAIFLLAVAGSLIAEIYSHWRW
jgi:hypothetical protein